jgi:hypothetical protein
MLAGDAAMKAIRRQDKARLLTNAKVIAALLKPHTRATSLRVRIPSRAVETNTDGWAVVVGNLGKNQPRLEIWLDRFSRHPERKFFMCFRSAVRRGVVAMTKRLSRKLWPIRVISSADINDGKTIFLLDRLKRSEFHAPVLEKYADGATFFGLYDPTREKTEKSDTYFCDRAVAFFADVVHELPRAAQDEEGEVYPQYENRKIVASHLRRERSRLLANECKIRDNHTCQVCGFQRGLPSQSALSGLLLVSHGGPRHRPMH